VLALLPTQLWSKTTRAIQHPLFGLLWCLAFLIVLNIGLYLFLSPSLIPNSSTQLPFVDLLERPNLEWKMLQGTPRLESGRWVATSKVQAHLPVSVLPNQPYTIQLPLRLQAKSRVEVWVNAQRFGALLASHLVSLTVQQTRSQTVQQTRSQTVQQTRSQTVQQARLQLAVWRIWASGKIEVLEAVNVEAAPNPTLLEVQVNRRALAVRLNQRLYLSAGLSYLGGVVGLGLENATLEQVQIILQADTIQPAISHLPNDSWFASQGTWRERQGVLAQIDPRGFDHVLVHRQQVHPHQLEMTLSGFGAGLVLAMPSINSLEQAYLVRFSEDGTAVFWGQFRQGRFVGLGSRRVKPKNRQTLRLECNKATCLLWVQNQSGVLGGIKTGYLALTASQSVAQFWALQVNGRSLIAAQGGK
jgi:hypothetical protein